MESGPYKGQTLRLLVTVKTYPTPSVSHMETVCTAGITDQGQWVRLYPVPFRYLQRRYRLYDWVEVAARKRPQEKDRRKESYEPVSEPQVVGRASEARNWRERKALVLPHARKSIEQILDGYSAEGESLGLIRPAAVTEVVVERETRGWSKAHRRLFEQPRLFGLQQKPLERPDHRFCFRFICDDPRCKGHTLPVLDWGLNWLYVREKRDAGAAAAVRKAETKCWQLISPERDTHLYVGTIWPYRTFAVLGVFAPRRELPDRRTRLCFDQRMPP